jgi:hypothetical protein
MDRKRLHVDRLRNNPLHRQMVENRRQALEEHERSRRRIFALAIVSFFFWTAVSVALASWGMGTVRWVEHSLLIIEVGVLLGLAGILVTLLIAHHRLGR